MAKNAEPFSDDGELISGHYESVNSIVFPARYLTAVCLHHVLTLILYGISHNVSMVVALRSGRRDTALSLKRSGHSNFPKFGVNDIYISVLVLEYILISFDDYIVCNWCKLELVGIIDLEVKGSMCAND